jgi:nucleotide-binding universal stress UspA family protein
MNEAAFPNVSSPVFLAQPSFSTQSAIHALLDYADEREVELIAVGTHSKQALERFFVGSFAETLVLASVYPVFLVSPHNQQNLKKDRILFPTDFSEKSHIVFEKLLPTALEKHAKVVLFHKTPVEVPPPVFGFDPIPVYEVFLAQDKKEKEKLAETWREEAFRQGVEVEILFHDLPGYPVDAILSNALSQRCGMIALASESGATAATLLGSMSRQIMRHAPCPVWILHPAEKRVN